jgi:flagellar biosynthesis/type III secretory pathway protein FliH
MAAMDSTGYCFPDISGDIDGGAARDASPCFRRLSPGAEPGRAAGRTGRRGEQARVDLEQEFYCKGFADGERSGHEQGVRAASETTLRQIDTLLDGLRRAADDLQRLRVEADRTHEWELVQLALAVAGKIVEHEVRGDPAALAAIVRSALTRVHHAQRVTLRMNPADVERLHGLRPQMLEGVSGDTGVRFEPDETIRPGGCLLESDRGDVDARIEQRLQVVEEAFRAEWAVGSAAAQDEPQ